MRANHGRAVSAAWVSIIITGATASQAAPTEPRDDIARVDLAVSFPSLGGLSSGGAALGGVGVGALGSWVPSVEAAFELHLVGPLWAVGRATGSYSQDALDGRGGAWSGSLGGDAGVRLEAPIFSWLEGGGHALFGIQGSKIEADGFAGSALLVRGVAGVGAHLRPTDFFGVRLSLDVLSAGHSTQSGDGLGRASSTFVAWTAAPRVELTFTF